MLTIPYVVEPIGMFVPIVRNLLLKRAYHPFPGTKMLRGAAAIISTAEQEKAELISGGIPPKNCPSQKRRRTARFAARTRLISQISRHLPSNAKLILFLGRLSQKKSPDLLLQAFAQLPPSSTSRHISSSSGLTSLACSPAFDKWAAQLGVASRVHFSGPLSGDPQMVRLRDRRYLRLGPSQNENFGNTAAESVAAGTP